MSVPADIAGIGSTAQRLRVAPGFDPLKAALGPEEYFVFSRIDGATSIKDILMATGLPVERGVQIVTRLRSIGAVLLPGESAASVTPATSQAARAPAAPAPGAGRPPTGQLPPIPAVSRQATPTPPSGVPRAPTPPPVPAASDLLHDLRLPNPTAEELAALSEDVELDDTERRRLLAIQRLLEKNDPYMILGVSPVADNRTFKRAYFLLSKEIHPDRYYGKRLGTFADRMSRVFEATSRAYARVTGNDKARGTGSNASAKAGGREQQPQTPQEYAAELFDRACQLEIGGDHLGAMKLFAAAVRVDPQTRYLRRAASCALQAGQPRSALEYAKKAHAQAPNDVSSARLLAAAFRAAGKLSDAEEVLVMAMAMKSENDVLTAELRNDLAEVRRMLAT